MKVTEQTMQQVERGIRRIAQKFPLTDDITSLTDIHLLVSQDTGEMVAYDDDDQEISRCVIEQWIENKDEDFYEEVTKILRKASNNLRDVIDNLGILKPYSLVLEDDDRQHVAEIYMADDDTIIVGHDLMEGLDRDLDAFLNDLLKQ